MKKYNEHKILGLYHDLKSSPFRGPFLATAEGCSLYIHWWGPLGPTKGPEGLDEFSGKCSENFANFF